MKKVFSMCLVFLLALSAFADDLADSILKKADQYRNRWASFVLKTNIIDYKNDKKIGENSFEVMIKGADKSLVRFLNADQKGQYLLMHNDNMWLSMPNTRRPIRVTPLQKLAGDAANGDVARTNFSRDYNPTLLGEDNVDGVLCYKLELHATTDAATYQRVVYWVTKNNSKPVKAELFLASGKLFKSITYDKYALIDGLPTMTQMTLHDRLREGRYSVMQFSDYTEKDIPDTYFNKNYLTKLK